MSKSAAATTQLSPRQRLAAAAKAVRPKCWFDKLDKASQAKVLEYIAAGKAEGASLSVVHRVLADDGVISCDVSTFRLFAHSRGANG